MAKVFPDELFPDEEHTLLAHTLRQFVKDKVEPQAQEFNEKENFNKKLFKELAPLGLLGITAPVQYGGSEMDATSVVITHEELSYSDPGFCLAYLAHSILCVNNIATNGSPAQKEKFLPKLCSGEAIGAMALSEPGCGTDVLAMQTTAEKKDNTYILNGRKMWITNGTVDEGETPCDVVVVYARSNITGSAPPEKISTFIVTKNTPGFSVGQKITGKLGMRSSNTAELCFDNCCIPAENLMGKEGESLFHMMRNLEIERLSLAAMGLGIARRCLDTMISYSTQRKAFGKNLHQFGQIQKYIADSYAEYKAAAAYVYLTAKKLDLKKGKNRLDSDGCKIIAAKSAKKIADRAIQVLGGYGYTEEYVVGRLWKDAKLLEIGGGTLEAHEKNITKDLVSEIK